MSLSPAKQTKGRWYKRKKPWRALTKITSPPFTIITTRKSLWHERWGSPKKASNNTSKENNHGPQNRSGSTQESSRPKRRAFEHPCCDRYNFAFGDSLGLGTSAVTNGKIYSIESARSFLCDCVDPRAYRSRHLCLALL